MTTVYTLASGSSGNAAVITCRETCFLLDAGISCRRIADSLHNINVSLESLTAILITHTHSDHISGLQTLLKKTSCPIYATPETCRQLSYRLAGVERRLCPLECCQSYTVGDISITPIPTSHDAVGSCGYRLDCADGSVGLCTDTGYVTEEMESLLPNVDLVLLEANHDVEMLRSGPYPYYLKQRILGMEGHLSNDDSARFAVVLAQHGATQVILSHLSQENNSPAVAARIVSSALSAAGLSPRVTVAPRDRMSEPYQLLRSDLCKK